jgi:hypothetical protein
MYPGGAANIRIGLDDGDRSDVLTGGSGFVHEQVDMRMDRAARATLNDSPRPSIDLD